MRYATVSLLSAAGVRLEEIADAVGRPNTRPTALSNCCVHACGDALAMPLLLKSLGSAPRPILALAGRRARPRSPRAWPAMVMSPRSLTIKLLIGYSRPVQPWPFDLPGALRRRGLKCPELHIQEPSASTARW